MSAHLKIRDLNAEKMQSSPDLVRGDAAVAVFIEVLERPDYLWWNALKVEKLPDEHLIKGEIRGGALRMALRAALRMALRMALRAALRAALRMALRAALRSALRSLLRTAIRAHQVPSRGPQVAIRGHQRCNQAIKQAIK